MIKAVFLDVDGTLVSFKTHIVPQGTVDAIRDLRKKGVKVFVATGRMLPMLEEVLAGIEFDGYIGYNGACCVDASKEKVIYKQAIPRNELDALVERLKYDKFPVAFMCRRHMYVNCVSESVLDVARMVNVLPPLVQDPEITIQEDVYQLCIYQEDAKLKEIMDEVLTGCEYCRWTSSFADVNVKGLDKSKGIDKVLEYFNIPLEEAMAFGDGGNDIPMLKHVPLSVAMGNAAADVKEAAFYVTESVDEDGVANALKHFGLL